jgi:hypothetical protein
MFTRFDAVRIKPDDSQLTVRSDEKLLCEPLIGSARGRSEEGCHAAPAAY